MKSLPPHYSWLPFSAPSRSVRILSPSLSSNFYSLTLSTPPLLSSSLHCLPFLLRSISAIKAPLIHFANKQTLSLSPSLYSTSPAPPQSVYLYSLFTARYTFTQTHSDTQREREWADSSWALGGWIGPFICRQIDREWSQSDLPVQQVFCLVTWWCSSPYFSSSPILFCALSRCVGCCLLAPQCVTLRVCVCSRLACWGVKT